MSCSDAEKKAIKEKLEKLAEENEDEINDLVKNPEKLKKKFENFTKELDPKIKEFVEKNNIPDTDEGAKKLFEEIKKQAKTDDEEFL